MPDLTLEVRQAAPQKLAALLELVMTPEGAWQQEELRAILQGRLNPSQPPPPEDASSESHPPLEESILAGDLEIQTLQELFNPNSKVGADGIAQRLDAQGFAPTKAVSEGDTAEEAQSPACQSAVARPPRATSEFGFTGAGPSLELLRQVKDFTKAHLEHPGSAWPSEVARMVYYTAIAAALVRHHARITRMAPEEIQRALQWGLAQPWATPSLRDLFQEAIHFLAAR